METKYRPVLEVFPFTENTSSTLHCKTGGKSHAVVGLCKIKSLQCSAKQQHCSSHHDIEWITTFTPSATLTVAPIIVLDIKHVVTITKALLQHAALAGKMRIIMLML